MVSIGSTALMIIWFRRLGMCINDRDSGLTEAQRDNMRKRKREWREAVDIPIPTLPEKKKFVPRYDLPKLESYMGKFDEQYWKKWHVRKMVRGEEDKSWVDPVELRKLGERSGLRDRFLLDRVCDRLKKGVEVGVEGRGRLCTRMRNSPTVYEHGHAVSEALQEGIMEGYITGPYSEGELVELVGKDFSVNPMSCREKPNGKQRRQGWLFSC